MTRRIRIDARSAYQLSMTQLELSTGSGLPWALRPDARFVIYCMGSDWVPNTIEIYRREWNLIDSRLRSYRQSRTAMHLVNEARACFSTGSWLDDKRIKVRDKASRPRYLNLLRRSACRPSSRKPRSQTT